jgi:hypothetical protein
VAGAPAPIAWRAEGCADTGDPHIGDSSGFTRAL